MVKQYTHDNKTRSFMKKKLFQRGLAAVLCISLVIPMTGCSTQTTIAETLSAISVTMASVAAIDGNSQVATVATDLQIVSTAVAQWQTGTSTAAITADINNLVAAATQIIPGSVTERALIGVVVSLAEELLVDFTQPAANTTAVILHGKTMTPAAGYWEVRKLSSNYKGRMNTILSHDPKYATVRVK
jgi:hypothetical protein